ncbi:hypothetical protein BJX76DRAFT_344481 [Aspergillus varians]
MHYVCPPLHSHISNPHLGLIPSYLFYFLQTQTNPLNINAMSLESASLVTTANRAGTRLNAAQSSLSITHFPPDSPTIAFIRTSPQASGKLPRPFPLLSCDQTALALQNLKACLAVADATPRDITKLTVYLKNGAEASNEQMLNVITGFFTNVNGQVHRPPCTILAVERVIVDGFDKVAVEAEAVVRLKPPSYDSL